MYPLLLCSLLSVMIAVERTFYYRRNWQSDDGLQTQIHAALDAQDWEEAIRVCDKFDTVVSRTVKAGLVHARLPQLGTMVVKDAFEERMAVEVTGLKKHLDYLSAIVTVAPLLASARRWWRRRPACAWRSWRLFFIPIFPISLTM